MDLNEIRPSERTIEIMHPSTGEPVGLRITLMSGDDERMRKAIRAANDYNMAKRQKNKLLTTEDSEANQANLICAAIVAWDWYGEATFKGEKPDFTPANVRKVVTGLKVLRDQLDEELGDTKSFFQN